MKKRFINFMGLTDKDILEITTGYKILFKRILIGLLIVVVTIAMMYTADRFGFLDLIGYAFLGLIISLAFVIGLTAYAQQIGEDKLAVKEVVKYKNADGSEGSYTVIKKS